MPSLVVITGVTAAGKSTLERELVGQGACEPVISCTTRSPRTDETPGVDYHFMTPQDFVVGVKSGDIIAPGKTGGNHYGISLQSLNKAMASGKDSVVVVDPDGVNDLIKNPKVEASVVCVDVRGEMAFSRLHSRYLSEISSLDKETPEFNAVVDSFVSRFQGLQSEVENVQTIKDLDDVLVVSGNAPIESSVRAVTGRLNMNSPQRDVEKQIHHALERGRSMPSGNSLG